MHVTSIFSIRRISRRAGIAWVPMGVGRERGDPAGGALELPQCSTHYDE
jgi:hypothetical protein